MSVTWSHIHHVIKYSLGASKEIRLLNCKKFPDITDDRWNEENFITNVILKITYIYILKNYAKLASFLKYWVTDKWKKSRESVEGKGIRISGDIFVSYSWKVDQACPNRSTTEESLLPKVPSQEIWFNERVTNSKDHQLFYSEVPLVFPVSK